MKFKKLFIFLLAVTISLLASCGKEDFTVSFDTLGGTQISAQTVKEGKTATKPKNPTKEGYEFLGWQLDQTDFNFSTPITKNLTLTANWKILTFTVNFVTDGQSDNQTQKVEYGHTVTKPSDPQKDGFTFDGWLLNGFAYDFSTPVKSDITLTASWSEKPLSVTYNFPDGTSKTVSASLGSNFIEEPCNLGKDTVFDGWVTEDGERLTSSAKITDSVEVFANCYTNGLNFTLYEVSSYQGSSKTVYIPLYHGGVKITSIGEKAFYNTVIEQIIIPSNITQVKKEAFLSCHALTSVTFSEGLETIGEGAFFDCYSISELYIPDSVKSIGFGAFAQNLYLHELEDGKKAVAPGDCALENISIPFTGKDGSFSADSYFTYIFGAGRVTSNFKSEEGEEIEFNGETITVVSYNVLPSSLTKVTLRNAVSISAAAFYNCFTLEEITVDGENLLNIDDFAFSGCENAEISGCENATFIGDSAFYGTKFKGGRFENAVEVGEYAFAFCDMEEISFGNELATIGDASFAYTNISSFFFPSSVESVGDNAFYGCNNLLTVFFENPEPCDFGSTIFTMIEGDNVYYSDILIFVPNGDGENEPYKLYREDLYLRDYASGIYPISYKDYTGYVVEDGILEGYIKSQGESFTDITVPNGVKEIGSFAFYNCAKIKTVTMPEGFEKIGEYAFYNCTGVQYLFMPSTLKEIDDYAFAGFFVGNKLSRLYFPEGLERIGDGAFISSFNLKIIDIPSTVKYLGYLSFGMANSLERCYLRGTTVPEFGFYDNKLEEIDYNVFSMVNAGKTIIYTPAGTCQSGENKGKTYTEIYKNSNGFKEFAEYIKTIPNGAEVGHYGNGELFIDLDGCDVATVYTIVECEEDTSNMGGSKHEFKKEYGSYTLNGVALTLSFETFGTVNAVYANRNIIFSHDGKTVNLTEPKRYYDGYNWTNFILYDFEKGSGKGTFDMYGSFLTPFDWTIDGDKFKIIIDGNNKLPEHSEYIGAVEYVGSYDKTKDEFSVAFMLNDYEEIITYTASVNKKIYATAKEERLYGKYVCYSEANPDFAMYTIISYGNGILDFYIGDNLYEGCAYVIDGDTVKFSITILDLTLTLNANGTLSQDTFMDMDVPVYFIYEDDLLDPTVLPD